MAQLLFRTSLPHQELSSKLAEFMRRALEKISLVWPLLSSVPLAIARNLFDFGLFCLLPHRTFCCSSATSLMLCNPEPQTERGNPAQCPFSRYWMYAIYFLLSLPVVYQAFRKILEPKRTSVNIWSNCLTHDEMEVQKGQMLGSKANIKIKKTHAAQLPGSANFMATVNILPLDHFSSEARFRRPQQQLEQSLWSWTDLFEF